MVHGVGVLAKLRSAGIASEIYPQNAKINKQLDFGNKKKVPYVIVIGSDEVASGYLALKNMATGDQEKLTIDQIIAKLR
jgi:histidyl-tRNA synthetase